MIEIYLFIFGGVFLIITKFLDLRLLNKINEFDKNFPSTSITGILVLFYVFSNEEYKAKINYRDILIIWICSFLGVIAIVLSIYSGIKYI